MKAGRIRILVLLGVLFVVCACQEAIIGTEVPAEKRVPLVKDVPHTGNWQAFEYAMDYRYRYIPSKEGDSANLEFSASLERSSTGLDSLSIWIYLLDGDGRVMAVKSLYDSGYKGGPMERSFSVTLTVPADTSGISFYHTAMASRGHR
jgi:hypothetical protein